MTGRRPALAEPVVASHAPARHGACLSAAGVVAVVAALLASVPGRAVADEPMSVPPSTLETRALGALEMRTAALLLSDQQGGGLAGAVSWTMVPSDGAVDVSEDAGRVHLVVDLDGGSLVRDPAPGRLSVGLYGYVLTVRGAVVAHLAEGVVVDDAATVHAIRAGGLKLLSRIDLPPGSYVLRLLVREHEQDLLMLRSVDVRVPAAGAAEAQVFPPLVPEDAGDWVIARRAGPVEPGLVPEGMVAAALPVISASEGVDLVAVVAGPVNVASLRARVLDLQGSVVGEPALTVRNTAAHGTDGGVRALHGTLAPLQVPAGPYRLRLEVAGSDSAVGQAGGAEELEILVTDEDVKGPWTHLADRALSPSRAVREVGAAREAAGPAPERARWTDVYLRALGAESDMAGEDGAVERLMRLEESVVAAGSARQLSHLAEVERRTAGQVLELDPACLATVVVVHWRTSRRYAAGRDELLARHARGIVSDVLEDVMGRKADDDTRALARAVLLRLATDAVRESSMSAALSFLERARRWGGEDPGVLLALGALHERSGEPREAVDPLRRLVEVAPEHGEGRLRLGVDLARTGQGAAASEILRPLLDGPQGWESVVAWQEMGRLLIGDGRLGEAVTHLRRGVERFPGDQTLHVLLAYALDMGGRPGDAARVVEEMPRARDSASGLARLHYAGWPDLDLDRLWSKVEDSARQGQETLASAVDRLAAEEPS